jgi:hypothetical protein
MAVSLASCAGGTLPLGIFLILISVRGWVDPRAIVRLEGLGKLKKSNNITGNRTRDLPAMSFCPNLRWNYSLKSPSCDSSPFTLQSPRNAMMNMLFGQPVFFQRETVKSNKFSASRLANRSVSISSQEIEYRPERATGGISVIVMETDFWKFVRACPPWCLHRRTKQHNSNVTNMIWMSD